MADNQLALNQSGVPIHQPVMCDSIIELLSPALTNEGSYYVDLTCGMAGHARAMLAANPTAHLIGVDQDGAALEVAKAHLAGFAGRFTLVRARFDELVDVLAELDVPKVNAILADLGLSSLQIDQQERGFSYSNDAVLDMRMDDRNELSAADVINSYSADELAHIFTRYGEQPAAKRIAQAICQARAKAPITTSSQLVQVIVESLPAALKQKSGHPAKRIFQALRIEVNQELLALEQMLPQALAHLAVGGRFAVLSYHSLEDRLVKQAFAKASSDQVPARMPVVPEEYRAQFKLAWNGARKPSPAEIEQNPRAASAKLRVIERIKAAKEAK